MLQVLAVSAAQNLEILRASTCSTCSTPQYVKPKYCERTKYLKCIISKILYFTPRYYSIQGNHIEYLVGPTVHAISSISLMYTNNIWSYLLWSPERRTSKMYSSCYLYALALSAIHFSCKKRFLRIATYVRKYLYKI